MNKIIRSAINKLSEQYDDLEVEQIIIEMFFLVKLTHMLPEGFNMYHFLSHDFDDFVEELEWLGADAASNISFEGLSNAMNNFIFDYETGDIHYSDESSMLNKINIEDSLSLKEKLRSIPNIRNLYNTITTNLNSTITEEIDIVELIDDLLNIPDKDMLEFIEKNLLTLEKQEIQTPDGLISLSNSIFENNSTSELLILCSGIGKYLSKSINFDTVYGQEYYYKKAYISKIRAFIANINNAYVEVGDVLASLNVSNSSNKYSTFKNVFCHIPWLPKLPARIINGMSDANWNYMNFEFDLNTSPDWAFVTVIANSLSKDGIGIAIISSGSLSKLTDIEIRKQLVDRGLVKAVIQLPKNLLQNSAIDISMLILSKNNDRVKFIDASEMYTSKRKISMLNVEEILSNYFGKTNDFISRSTLEISQNNYSLNPSIYFGDIRLLFEQAKSLGNYIVDVFRGIQLTSKELDMMIHLDNPTGKEYKMITLSNFDNTFIEDNLQLIKASPRLDRYLLKHNDIILSSKSSKIKSALVVIENNEKIFASGNIIVLRLDNKKLRPQYLKVFFDSDIGQKYLNSLQTGNVIISLNSSQIKEMVVPIPSLEKQERISEKYLAYLDMLKITRSKLRSIEDSISALFLKEM